MTRDGIDDIDALYVHTPFCVKKCAYCDFNSISYKEGLADDYLKALEKEMDRAVLKSRRFKTIYIGGGTPTALNEKQLTKLLGLIKCRVDNRDLVEYTIEANPGTVNSEKAAILKENLVNRISFGAQSFNNRHLKQLGRIHDANAIFETFSLFRNNGFENINLDLIFGLPYQSVEEWENDLKAAIELNPDHISTYALTYEDGTALKNRLQCDEIKPVDEIAELEMYKLTINLLRKAGFDHYEISNFAKNGKKSAHNMAYWKNMGYIGVGVGAFSFIKGSRKSNEKSVEKYIQNADSLNRITAFQEHLPPKEHAAETIIMGLRMIAGISAGRFLKQTGYSFEELYSDGISNLEKQGFVKHKNNRLALTEKGLYVADSVMMEFLN